MEKHMKAFKKVTDKAIEELSSGQQRIADAYFIGRLQSHLHYSDDGTVSASEIINGYKEAVAYAKDSYPDR